MPDATRVRSFTMTTDVDVEIDPDDLHEAGWHHEDECTARAAIMPAPLGAATASLHRQAHPSQPADVALCREEPCRSLSFEQVRAVSSHA